MSGTFHMTMLINKGMETLHLCASHEPFLFLNLGTFFPCKSVGQLSIRREISTSSFVNSAGSGRHRKYRRQTLLFFLTGYILTGVWMIFLTSDLCYLRSDGVWRSFSREAILWSGLFAVITGFLPPLVCFPLKFYSWKLAWGALTTLFLGGLLFTIFHVNTPEQIFRNRFGALAAEVRLEALKVSNSYESSCEIYKLSGDTKKIQTALETLFSNETPRESFDTRFLPDWMLAEIPVKNPLPVLEFSIYFRTWSDGQYFYIWFNTWEYHGLTQWEAKVAPHVRQRRNETEENCKFFDLKGLFTKENCR